MYVNRPCLVLSSNVHQYWHFLVSEIFDYPQEVNKCFEDNFEESQVGIFSSYVLVLLFLTKVRCSLPRSVCKSLIN